MQKYIFSLLLIPILLVGICAVSASEDIGAEKLLNMLLTDIISMVTNQQSHTKKESSQEVINHQKLAAHPQVSNTPTAQQIILTHGK